MLKWKKESLLLTLGLVGGALAGCSSVGAGGDDTVDGDVNIVADQSFAITTANVTNSTVRLVDCRGFEPPNDLQTISPGNVPLIDRNDQGCQFFLVSQHIGVNPVNSPAIVEGDYYPTNATDGSPIEVLIGTQFNILPHEMSRDTDSDPMIVTLAADFTYLAKARSFDVRGFDNVTFYNPPQLNFSHNYLIDLEVNDWHTSTSVGNGVVARVAGFTQNTGSVSRYDSVGGPNPLSYDVDAQDIVLSAQGELRLQLDSGAPGARLATNMRIMLDYGLTFPNTDGEDIETMEEFLASAVGGVDINDYIVDRQGNPDIVTIRALDLLPVGQDLTPTRYVQVLLWAMDPVDGLVSGTSVLVTINGTGP